MSQAQVNKNGEIEVTNSVDLNEVVTCEVVAWKKGVFSFKGADIERTMKEVSRWYDVNVVFEKPVEGKFYAEASRNCFNSTLNVRGHEGRAF